MSTVKPSRYNHFFPYQDGKSIAFNALSTSLALIGEKELSEYNAFCTNGTPLPTELEADLRKGLFVLDDFVNELDVLRYRMLRSRYGTDSLAFTLAPTNDCQFDCVYCYEKGALTNKYMTQEVQDKIVEMLEQRKGLISHFDVTWYGGEPLLAFDILENMSKRFIQICDDNQVSYKATIITNGYLLNRDFLERMKHLRIEYIQITIDGLPEMHNQRRPLRGGGDTFETIMNNLKDGYDLLPPINLRVNIDRVNIAAGESVRKFLIDNGLQEKVRPYFGMLMNYTGSYDSAKCLSACDFSEHSYDYAVENASLDTPVQYPMLKSAFCGADSYRMSVLDAEGWMYKCWCDLGVTKRRVGSVIEEFKSTNDLLMQYMLYDPTTSEPCMGCDVLPLCMGGCPYKRIMGNTDNCSNYKFILDKCIKNAASAFQVRKIREDKKD